MSLINFSIRSFQILLIIIVISCVSKNEEENNVSRKTSTINITIKNDSIIQLHNIEFNLSELESQLDKLKTNNSVINKVIISPKSNVKLGTITKVEYYLARNSIKFITYVYNNDSTQFYLDSISYKQLKFELNDTGILLFNGQEMSSDQELEILLKKLVKGQSHPRVSFSVPSGLGYGYYLTGKNRIYTTLNKIDSTLNISEGYMNCYKKIK